MDSSLQIRLILQKRVKSVFLPGKISRAMYAPRKKQFAVKFSTISIASQHLSSELALLRPVDPELPHPPLEGAGVESEALRRVSSALDLPLALLEHFDDMVTFQGIQILAGPGLRFYLAREVLADDQRGLV